MDGWNGLTRLRAAIVTGLRQTWLAGDQESRQWENETNNIMSRYRGIKRLPYKQTYTLKYANSVCRIQY